MYRYPATPYVATFLGFHNLVEGTVLEARATADDKASTLAEIESLPASYVVDTPLGRLVAADVPRSHAPGTPVTVLVRPEAAEVRPAGASGENIVSGLLLEVSFPAALADPLEHASGITLVCEVSVTPGDLPPIGKTFALRLDPAAVTLLADS